MCPAVAYEMLVSHSPPVFSHSPPTGFLSDYSPFRLNPPPDHQFHHQRPSRTQTCRSASSLSFYPSAAAVANRACPKRPCLVIRPGETIPNPPSEAPPSPSRLKKRVVFADDKGMSLTHVRVMTEPSNVPPLWSYRYLAEVTQGVTAEPEAHREPWKLKFAQPASDYVDFRKRLDNDKVSLENVIVKDAEEMIVGTVKVSNLSFCKEVFVRISFDNWKTFEDDFCNFVPNSATSSGGSAPYVLYDTFAFKIAVPPRGRKIEFCVGYKCNGHEYWDSNNGHNYAIVKEHPTSLFHKSLSSDNIFSRMHQSTTMRNKGIKLPNCGDAVQTKIDSWSEFASWTHLENTTPYW